MNAWTIAETPVLTAAIFAVLGFWYKAQRLDNQRRDHSLATHSEALAVLVESMRPIRTWQNNTDQRLHQHDARIGSLSEATAVLSATLEAHQNWHSEETRQATRHRVSSLSEGNAHRAATD